MSARVAKGCRALQQAGLYLLLFMLPASPAAVEITFFLLLFGWISERLALGWAGSMPDPGQRRTAASVVRAGWRSSIWASQRQQASLLMVLLYVGLCGLTIFWSCSPEHSVNGWVGKTLEYALFLIMVPDVIRNPVVVRRALAILMISACVVGLDAVAQEWMGRDPLRGYKLSIYRRMTGPYSNPGDLACYLMVVLPLVLTSACRLRGWGRSALVGLSLLLLGCLVRAECQGAWLGFVVALAVLAALIPSWRAPMVITGLVFLAAGGWWLQREGRLSSIVRLSDIGTRDRLVVWQAAWRMIQDRPVLGHGLNTFMARYLDYWVGGERQPRYAHNCYLQVAAETGLIGLGLFLGLLAALFRRLLDGIRAAPPDTTFIAAGVMAGLAAFALQASLDTNFYSLRQAALFWVLMGLALGISEPSVALPPAQQTPSALLVPVLSPENAA